MMHEDYKRLLSARDMLITLRDADAMLLWQRRYEMRARDDEQQ